MAKNVILVIGDGMGWEMARSAAIYNQVETEIKALKAANKTDTEIKTVFASRTLDYYYTEGKGTGTEFQKLTSFKVVTDGATKIAGSTGNSALDGSIATHNTGDAAPRAGFVFDPNTNYVNWDTAKGGDAPWDPNYYANRAKTSTGFDKEYIKADYPDSANTASTLYGGIKTYNGAISVDIGEQAFASILMDAKAQGKSGGVVSSVPINHATPGAAVANVNSRNKYQEASNAGKYGVDGHPLSLIDNILDDVFFDSKPQVIFGGGNPAGGESYVTKKVLPSFLDGSYRASANVLTGVDANGKDIVTGQTPVGKTIKEVGWTVIGRPDDYTGANATKTGLELLTTAVTAFNPATDHLMAIYGAKGQGGNLPWRTADNDYSATGTGGYADPSNLTATNTALTGDALAAELKANPTVAQLAGQAATALGKDKDGFWLMVEVGDIDWAAHADNMDLMLGTMHDMDDTVKTLTTWIAANGGWDNNQLLVTADHDHYLTLLPNYPKEIAESILASLASTAAAPNEATTGGNKGYDLNLTPTLTINDKSQWKPGDADAVGHFWGTTTPLADTAKTVGQGDGWWTHTQRPVPLYYQGADANLIDIFVSTGVEAYGTVIKGVPGMIDQAHIAKAMDASLLGGATAAQRLAKAQGSVISPPSTAVRLLDSVTGVHLTTASATEAATLVGRGWRNEGASFVMGDAGIASAGNHKQVFRLFNSANGDHLLTTNTDEVSAANKIGYVTEGVAGSIQTSSILGASTAVNRFFNGREHLFTSSVAETNALVAGGWKNEGVLGYVA